MCSSVLAWNAAAGTGRDVRDPRGITEIQLSCRIVFIIRTVPSQRVR